MFRNRPWIKDCLVTPMSHKKIFSYDHQWTLCTQDDFELGVAEKDSEYEKSDSSSENEVAVSHEQNRINILYSDAN